MTNLEMHSQLCDKLHEMYLKKNHDYGNSFSKTFEEEGFAMSRIRLSDKLNRFKVLSKAVTAGEERKVQDESMTDTLMDLANYSLMTVIEIERRKVAE